MPSLRRRLRPVEIATAAALLLLPASARAATLYVQPATTPILSARTSQDQGPPFGTVDFQTFDNFTLLASANITGVSWQGSYLNSLVSNGAFQPPANASSFAVQFYSDLAGIPGSLLANYSFTPAQANETFNRQEQWSLNSNFGLAVYDYQTLLPSAFLALAGTQYWLSVYALEPPASATEAQWLWNNGTGGNAASYQTPIGGVFADRALTLTGDAVAAVPEPSAMILLGSGLVLLARRLKTGHARSATKIG